MISKLKDIAASRADILARLGLQLLDYPRVSTKFPTLHGAFHVSHIGIKGFQQWTCLAHDPTVSRFANGPAER